MKEVNLRDNSGNQICLMEWNGTYLPPFFEEEGAYFSDDKIEYMKKIKIRPDDVLLITFPKSGTHWNFEILQMLMGGTTETSGDSKMVDYYIELFSKDLEKKSSPRVLITHLSIDQLPKELLDQKPKMIYVWRNPKDVAVSQYNHCFRTTQNNQREYDGKFMDFLQLFAEGKVPYGSWFHHVHDYEKHQEKYRDNLFGISYESLKKNPVKGIGEIVKFLDIDRSEEFIKKVADMTGFNKMKERNGFRFLNKVDNTPLFFRKGEIGDWKNWFTVASNEWFDKVCQEKMRNTNVELAYSY